VYEHATATIAIKDYFISASQFLNRPGVWVRISGDKLRVTFNPRVVLDWHAFGSIMPDTYGVHGILKAAAHNAWPAIVDRPKLDMGVTWHPVMPETDEEKWVSLYVAGSRGMSHEAVRHGDFTAISQRSTRYVNEDESPWVEHPLMTAFLESTDPLPDDPEGRWRGALKGVSVDVVHAAQNLYSKAVDLMQGWLVSRKVDKATARKQARGAARGYLGNALATEMIFSANVAQWKRMLRMRATVHADAEIRRVFVLALGELKKSAYGDCFERFSVAPSPDGLGEIAVEAEAKSQEAAP
jgi:hypothetical protein